MKKRRRPENEIAKTLWRKIAECEDRMQAIEARFNQGQHWNTERARLRRALEEIRNIAIDGLRTISSE